MIADSIFRTFKGSFARISLSASVRAIWAACFLMAVLAVAMHAPGHVSMDSSVQLHEAAIAKSVSWNPPFMSALLRWLGGGEVGITLFVFLSTVLTYGAFVLVAETIAEARRACETNFSTWRVLIAIALVSNPIVAIYTGIVWKDVLFASVLAMGAALGVAAGYGSIGKRAVCAVLSVALLVVALLVRQQGIFMAPVLMLVPILSLSAGRASLKLKVGALLFSLFLVSYFGLNSLVNRTIADDGGRATSVGFRSIMIFDAMGVVSMGSLSRDRLAFPIDEEQLAAVIRAYDPSRIDYIDSEPLASEWFGGQSNHSLKKIWLDLVFQNPGAYLKHRAVVYATLLGLRGMKGTLPVHVGIDGNPEYLKGVGLTQGQGPRAREVYRFASSFFNWPIFRHIFWIVVAAAALVVAVRSQISGSLRGTLIFTVFAVFLLFFSYIPTTIASDFRYLYPAIPLVTIAWLIILLGACNNKQMGAANRDW